MVFFWRRGEGAVSGFAFRWQFNRLAFGKSQSKACGGGGLHFVGRHWLWTLEEYPVSLRDNLSSPCPPLARGFGGLEGEKRGVYGFFGGATDGAEAGTVIPLFFFVKKNQKTLGGYERYLALYAK